MSNMKTAFTAGVGAALAVFLLDAYTGEDIKLSKTLTTTFFIVSGSMSFVAVVENFKREVESSRSKLPTSHGKSFRPIDPPRSISPIPASLENTGVTDGLKLNASTTKFPPSAKEADYAPAIQTPM